MYLHCHFSFTAQTHNIKNVKLIITSFCTSTCAPFYSKMFTTSTCPFRDAAYSAVTPFCQDNLYIVRNAKALCSVVLPIPKMYLFCIIKMNAKVQNSPRHELMLLWIDLPWRHDQWQLMKHIGRLPHTHGNYACALSAGKWPTVHTYDFSGGILDFFNRAVSEKTPQIF